MEFYKFIISDITNANVFVHYHEKILDFIHDKLKILPNYGDLLLSVKSKNIKLINWMIHHVKEKRNSCKKHDDLQTITDFVVLNNDLELTNFLFKNGYNELLSDYALNNIPSSKMKRLLESYNINVPQNNHKKLHSLILMIIIFGIALNIIIYYENKNYHTQINMLIYIYPYITIILSGFFIVDNLMSYIFW